jgi:RHS repeat-associated protein
MLRCHGERVARPQLQIAEKWERARQTPRRRRLRGLHARTELGPSGRFSSVDPGKDWDPKQPQSWNMYAYVRNNPVNRTDPKYQCVGGNDAACNTVAGGLEEMKEAAAAAKKNDSQRKELQRMINAYGAPGDPNTRITNGVR